MKYSYVYYDWKLGGCEEQYKAALADFNLIMTPDPLYEGSDSFAFFITTFTPTKEQIKEMMILEHGPAILEELEV